jgi:hypothetical protein
VAVRADGAGAGLNRHRAKIVVARRASGRRDKRGATASFFGLAKKKPRTKPGLKVRRIAYEGFKAEEVRTIPLRLSVLVGRNAATAVCRRQTPRPIGRLTNPNSDLVLVHGLGLTAFPHTKYQLINPLDDVSEHVSFSSPCGRGCRWGLRYLIALAPCKDLTVCHTSNGLGSATFFHPPPHLLSAHAVTGLASPSAKTLFAPPALSERCHRRLARCFISVRCAAVVAVVTAGPHQERFCG